jgi:heme/copper-type cytochrome/quinol oxidase subunit 4
VEGRPRQSEGPLFFAYMNTSAAPTMWTVELIFIVLIPALIVWVLHCLNVYDRIP